MTRRRQRHAALSLLILTTAPALGLFCRGHSPSRFTPANLPSWERTLPRPAPMHVALHSSPLLDFLPGDSQAEAEAIRTRPDDPLFSVGQPSHAFLSPARAGRSGLWLLAVCPQGRHDATLRAEQDAVALHLMEAQQNDGYLADGSGLGRWSQAQVTVHGQNLRGLLAYYAVSHSPAAVYAAIQAGDLVLSRFPSAGSDEGRTGGLVSSMALLYQATGEVRYRDWAEKRAQDGLTDGPGLCALYMATGERRYLQRAQRMWHLECARHKTDQDLAATLRALTGAPGYAKALHPGAAPEHYPTTGRPRTAT